MAYTRITSMTDIKPPKFELHELMGEYGLGTVQDVRIAKGGAVNENWIVRTAKRPWLCGVWHGKGHSGTFDLSIR